MTANGAKLERWRLDKEMSQKKLAAALGITDSSVSRWENGREPVPYARRKDLAAALGVDVAEIHALYDEEPDLAVLLNRVLAETAAIRMEMNELRAETNELRTELSHFRP